MLRGLLRKAATFPNKGIPMLTRGGASLGLRRKADTKARNTHAIRAPPAKSAVCGISRTASIASLGHTPTTSAFVAFSLFVLRVR